MYILNWLFINSVFDQYVGVVVSWEGEGGKKKCARLTPGKAYLNGRRNLQSVFRLVR